MAFIRRTYLLSGALAFVCLLALSTQAGAFLDTSGPVICAFTNGFDCDNAEGCQQASPESVGLPVFVKLDMANKKVTPTGRQTEDARETAIKGAYEVDGKIFLQGVERRGWSAVIDKETGQMAMAASSDAEAIVFFGKCTNP